MLGSIQDADIKLLRIFHTIVECGGFSLAQAKLNLSQSAISTHMSQLEARLGTRLCDRGHGTFKLTEDGRAVLRASEKLFAALENFKSDVAESQNQLRGELRIGFIDNSVTHPDNRIRNALKNFTDQAPEVRISIYVGGAIELEEQVMDNRLHLAIGLFHHNISTLEYTPLFDEEHLLYCGKDHPFFGCPDENIVAEDLGSAKYVSWGYVESLPGWVPPFSFHDLASTPYIEGAAHLILSGRFLAYLPTHYARFWTEQGQIRPILPDQTRRTATFHLVTSKSARMPQLTSAFLRELKLSDSSVKLKKEAS